MTAIVKQQTSNRYYLLYFASMSAYKQSIWKDVPHLPGPNTSATPASNRNW